MCVFINPNKKRKCQLLTISAPDSQHSMNKTNFSSFSVTPLVSVRKAEVTDWPTVIKLVTALADYVWAVKFVYLCFSPICATCIIIFLRLR